MTHEQREDSRLLAMYAAERAVEARERVRSAMHLLDEAARALKAGDVLWREMRALRGTRDSLMVVSRSLDDYWACWRDTASRAVASSLQPSTAVARER
jgi:hypothetical protein